MGMKKKSVRLPNDYWTPLAVRKAINSLLRERGLVLRLSTEDIYIRLRIVEMKDDRG